MVVIFFDEAVNLVMRAISVDTLDIEENFITSLYISHQYWHFIDIASCINHISNSS